MSTASKINLALLACLAGGFVPWKMGLLFLDPLVILPYAGLSLFYAGAAPGGDPLRLGLFGATYACAVIALGVLAVNAGLRQGAPLSPVWPLAVSAPVLSFSVSFFAATWARDHINRRNPPQEAASRIRWITLLLLMLWLTRASVIPAAVRELTAPATTTWGLAVMSLGLSGVMLLGAWGIASKRADA